jgi:transcriptional regulator with XRE-family HTH domain
MSLRGYSYQLVKANLAANPDLVGVQLGRYCIDRDISVLDMAQKLGVSKMTLYHWFIGRSVPHKTRAEKITKLLNKAKFSV